MTDDRTLIRRPFFRSFTDDGTPTGDVDGAQDFSASPTPFFVQPAAGEVFECNRVVVRIQDNGMHAPEGYGGGNALTNGIQIQVRTAATPKIPLPAITVFNNFDWNTLAMRYETSGVGMITTLIVINLEVTRFQLDGDLGENIALILNDDFSGLDVHEFVASGQIEASFQ